jgi:hypothetical protein
MKLFDDRDFSDDEPFSPRHFIQTTPLSSRDLPIYLRWRRDNWSISYRDDYLTTDWWSRVRAEAASAYSGCCHLCHSNRRPMNVHHNNYRESLWKERWSDIFYLCAECHSRFHEIIYRMGRKWLDYGGLFLMEILLDSLDSCCESPSRMAGIEEKIRRYIECFSSKNAMTRSGSKYLFASHVAKWFSLWCDGEDALWAVTGSLKTDGGYQLHNNRVKYRKSEEIERVLRDLDDRKYTILS